MVNGGLWPCSVVSVLRFVIELLRAQVANHVRTKPRRKQAVGCNQAAGPRRHHGRKKSGSFQSSIRNFSRSLALASVVLQSSGLCYVLVDRVADFGNAVQEIAHDCARFSRHVRQLLFAAPFPARSFEGGLVMTSKAWGGFFLSTPGRAGGRAQARRLRCRQPVMLVRTGLRGMHIHLQNAFAVAMAFLHGP